MSSVHYKFRSSLEYDTLSFDGPSISLSDLRDGIMVQKKIGKSSDYTLEVTNAQTKEVYQDPADQIPRNTSVVVKRVPVARLAAVTGKTVEPDAKETGDLANANASENDKITAMMQQSGELFQPDQYMNNKIRPGSGYICFRCRQPGHHIRNCPTIGDPRFNTPRTSQRASTEFYIMQMKERERLASLKAPVPSNRSFSPVVSSDAHSAKEIPAPLQCPMCKKLLNDAVVIPCCGTSYCDECIRNYLIENDFLCHSCKEKTSPDNIIPNKSVRKAVENFKNTSHRASTGTPPSTSTQSPSVDTTAKTEAAPVETKPKISINLLKRNDAKQAEKQNEPKSADDTLNLSAGPVTEAELFEQIARDTRKRNEQLKEAAEPVAVVKEEISTDEGKIDVDVTKAADSNTEKETGSTDEAKPADSTTDVNETKDSDEQPAPVTSNTDLQGQVKMQQPQLVAQQQQLQLQQQLQFQQLQQLKAQPMQSLDHGGMTVASQTSVMLQTGPQPMVSMPMVSSMNPSLAAQQVIVSGSQLFGSVLPTIGVSQGMQQRLIAPGLTAPVNPVANLGANVLRPVVGLSMAGPMASAFVPDSVHPVVPKLLPGMVASQMGRSTVASIQNRPMFDPLFNLASNELPGLPMSEEEFYRMKIKLKDGDGGRRKRVRSRSPARSDSYRSSKDRRNKRTERSRSRDRKRDRKSPRDRKSSRDRRRSKDRSESRSKSEKYREREKLRSSPRPEEYLKRKKKEKISEMLKEYDSFDDEEQELISDHRHPERNRQRESASRSRSKTFSPERISQRRVPKTSSRHRSSESWSRSPSPQTRDEKTRWRKEDFSGEEFETVRLEDHEKSRSGPKDDKKSRAILKAGKEKRIRKRKVNDNEKIGEAKLKGNKEERVLKMLGSEEENEIDQNNIKKRNKPGKYKEKENSKNEVKEKKKKLKENIGSKAGNSSNKCEGKLVSKKRREAANEDGEMKKGKKVKISKIKKSKIIENNSKIETKTRKKLVEVSSSQTESEIEVKMDAKCERENVLEFEQETFPKNANESGLVDAKGGSANEALMSSKTKARVRDRDRSVSEAEAIDPHEAVGDEPGDLDVLMKSIDEALKEPEKERNPAKRVEVEDSQNANDIELISKSVANINENSSRGDDNLLKAKELNVNDDGEESRSDTDKAAMDQKTAEHCKRGKVVEDKDEGEVDVSEGALEKISLSTAETEIGRTNENDFDEMTSEEHEGKNTINERDLKGDLCSTTIDEDKVANETVTDLSRKRDSLIVDIKTVNDTANETVDDTRLIPEPSRNPRSTRSSSSGQDDSEEGSDSDQDIDSGEKDDVSERAVEEEVEADENESETEDEDEADSVADDDGEAGSSENASEAEGDNVEESEEDELDSEAEGAENEGEGEVIGEDGASEEEEDTNADQSDYDMDRSEGSSDDGGRESEGRRKSTKELSSIKENGTEDSSEESESEADSKHAARKKKKRKEKKRREKGKKKKRKNYSDDEEEDDSDEENDSEDEEDRRRKKKRKAEKKSKRRKHKKRKHSKKHRKSKKEDQIDEESDFEMERKRKRKKRKSEDSDSDDASPSKFVKVSRSVKREKTKGRERSRELEGNGRIVVEMGETRRKGESRESRTVYVERDRDIRKVESRRKTKVSRTVRA